MSTTFDNISIGGRLKQLRQEKSLSQSSFSSLLGVSLQAYQNYERGDRPITKDLIVVLMTEFGVEPSWLLSGEQALESHSSLPELNEELLQQIIEGIESLLSKKRKVLPIDKKAKIIVMLYKTASIQQNLDPETIRQLIEIAA
ncbi:helix-turn-helix domain-containing protein [Shewanella sp. KJ2020]|uniref:helix-turn-helix domain-containing protein n=1 Tax=Shewanella sp. KJ2020 TaxID=2919172 RepID=UPI0020A77E9C|nr:helix-turn-helix transcriptional regulator [Shewanella sp. KJ2020]MCP3130047.1 helix-turn-helix domain-containing protein [Shewanella sp. KJ2020]